MVEMKLVDQGTASPEPPDELAETVDQFLRKLRKGFAGDGKEYYDLLAVLWFAYLIREPLMQLELAEKLGISDWLVSDYRRTIEKELQGLDSDFRELEDVKKFEIALRGRLSNLLDV